MVVLDASHEAQVWYLVTGQRYGVFGGRFPVLLQPQYLLRPFS